MRPRSSEALSLCFMLGLVATGCGDAGKDPNAGAPPPLKVEQVRIQMFFRWNIPISSRWWRRLSTLLRHS